MTQPTQKTLLESLPSSFDQGPAWLRELRRRAAAELRERGLPNKKTEAWRFTPVRSLVSSEFHADGSGVPALSSAPRGVRATSLRAALESDPAALEGRLGLGGSPTHFAALNAALFEDGLWLDVAPGTIVEAPLELSYLVPEGSARGVAYPRVLITCGEGAELTLIDDYAGHEDQHLTNSVVEVDLAPNAKLHHVRIHENAGLQVGRIDVRQAADSRYESTVVTLGGALLRFDIRCLLEGKGAECKLDGAYLVEGKDHVDHHTLVEHVSSHCRSEQTYRGIASDEGTAVFDGIVVVHRDAQKTEAHQENRNLLLSESATVHTKPHLEIDADDVVCSHGATVGALDENQLFYLRSRGIPEELSRAMLTYAFAEAIVDRVDHEPTRKRMREALLARIPRGDELREVT